MNNHSDAANAAFVEELTRFHSLRGTTLKVKNTLSFISLKSLASPNEAARFAFTQNCLFTCMLFYQWVTTDWDP